MKNYLTAAALALVGFLSTSCVATQADMVDLKESIESRNEQITSLRQAFADGLITSEQLAAGLQDANTTVVDSVNQTIDNIQTRGTGLVASIPTSGNPLVDGLGLIATIATTFFAGKKATEAAKKKEDQVAAVAARQVNVERDMRRMARGEPVEAKKV